MAKSINSRPDAVAHLPRHGHNLSHDFAFTSPVGYLLPVEYDFLFPGDSVSLDFSMQTITNPLEKPCMSGITEHIDVFFVPLRKLRTVAPEVITNVDDLPTSFISAQQVKNVAWVFPTASLRDFGSFAEEFVDAAIREAPTEERAIAAVKDTLTTGVLPTLRLLEHLGYNPDIFTDVNRTWRADDYQPQVSLMMLCAYQAIFYDYYRLSNFFENNVRAYNLDYVDLNPVDLYDIVQLHSRPYKRDYFKNIEPSPLQNSLGVLFSADTLSFDNVNQWLSANEYRVYDSNFSSDNNNSTQVQTGTEGQSTVSIRTAFAIEKLLRVSQRAGKHYDDQVLAHFGVKVDKGIANEVYYLGSHQQKIDFGMVVSQASTEDSPLGNLAGRGYSVANKNNRTIKFKAPCHGVLMAIYSAEPDIMYHTGLDKIHTMSDIYDFPLPEFDKLGMQPLFGYERRAVLDFASERLGWQFRYANFKQKYDRCTYAFTNFDDIRHLTYQDEGLRYGRGAYAPYVISEQNSYSLSSANRYRNSLIVQPNDTDQIFLLGFDPSVAFKSEWIQAFDTGNLLASDIARAFISAQYTTDPLIHKLGIRYFKSSWMSTFGEPDL